MFPHLHVQAEVVTKSLYLQSLDEYFGTDAPLTEDDKFLRQFVLNKVQYFIQHCCSAKALHVRHADVFATCCCCTSHSSFQLLADEAKCGCVSQSSGDKV